MIQNRPLRHLLVFLACASAVVGGLFVLLWSTDSPMVRRVVQLGFFVVVVVVLEISRRWWLIPGPDGTVAIRPLLETNAPAATVLIRLGIGPLFLIEGASALALFAGSGTPDAPQFWTTFLAVTQTAAGALVILGFLTRPAALALCICALLAITPGGSMLLGRPPGMLGSGGFDIYDADTLVNHVRTQWLLLLGALFLVLVGAGSFSLDAEVSSRHPWSP